MTVLDQQVAAARQDILAKEEELSSLDALKQGFEETLAAESENIVRSEARLKEIKTQKEYLAVSKEITAARKMKGELEEQLLQKIGQLEELKAEVAEQRGNLAQLEGNIAAQKAEVQGKVDALDHGLAEDRLARDQKAASLPAAVLKRYGTLRSNRRGLAVAEARDGSCLGCNMNIPPQLFNTLYRGTELITCPHCQRMLILKQQPQG
jgi:predicted  nucleic acid-binding Zn-ribbon protein